MAKTLFSNGSNLTPTYCNTIYGSGGTGGHQHDGTDADGHCGKIDLTRDTTGTLPWISLNITNGTYHGYIRNAIGTPTDATFGYSFINGLATVWWKEITLAVANWGYSSIQFRNYYDGTHTDQPTFLRPTPIRGPNYNPYIVAPNIYGTAITTPVTRVSSAQVELTTTRFASDATTQMIFYANEATQNNWDDSTKVDFYPGQITFQTGNWV
jgi:hypothetical protein